MFIKLNAVFSCESQPDSLLMATNIESDCLVKPKSGFMMMNIDFGYDRWCICRDSTGAPKVRGSEDIRSACDACGHRSR